MVLFRQKRENVMRYFVCVGQIKLAWSQKKVKFAALNILKSSSLSLLLPLPILKAKPETDYFLTYIIWYQEQLNSKYKQKKSKADYLNQLKVICHAFEEFDRKSRHFCCCMNFVKLILFWPLLFSCLLFWFLLCFHTLAIPPKN